MSAEESVKVDVELIMKQIREEVARNGPYEEILPFESIPIEEEIPELFFPTVKNQMMEMLKDLEIPPVFPLNNESFLKRLYKKVVTKIVRCATYPLAVKVNATNQKLKESLELNIRMMEQQQKQIEALTTQVKKLERKANGK